MKEPCYLCGQPSTIACSKCNSAWFCSLDHLVQIHCPKEAGGQCFPFKVQRSKDLGQYIVATRDLQPLDLVLRDTALPSGPPHDPTVVCLSCYTVLGDSSKTPAKCSQCGLPMCSQECVQDDIHREQECQIIRKRNINIPVDCRTKEHAFYKCVMVLRMLLLKQNSPDWKRIDVLMDHHQERKLQMEAWNTFQCQIVDYIQKDLGLSDLFSDADIHRCIGIIRVNAVQSRASNINMRALFPSMALLSNSCICNARCVHKDFGRLHGVEIRAQTAIKAGEEVTIQYNTLICGSHPRRKLFRDIWFFDCQCRRCTDSTELGSFLNGLACQKCKGKDAVVLPVDALDYDSEWKCDQEGCDFTLTDSQVCSLEDEAEELIDMGPPGKSVSLIDFCERLLEEKLSSQFHQHHYLLMKVKSTLISQYGNVPGYTYGEMSDALVGRKCQLCAEFIDVFGKVDPGRHSDWWAVTQYEAVQASTVLLQRDLDSGRVPIAGFKSALLQSRETLQHVVQVLAIEPPGTYLESLANKASTFINVISELVTFADFL